MRNAKYITDCNTGAEFTANEWAELLNYSLGTIYTRINNHAGVIQDAVLVFSDKITKSLQETHDEQIALYKKLNPGRNPGEKYRAVINSNNEEYESITAAAEDKNLSTATVTLRIREEREIDGVTWHYRDPVDPETAVHGHHFNYEACGMERPQKVIKVKTKKDFAHKNPDKIVTYLGMRMTRATMMKILQRW